MSAGGADGFAMLKARTFELLGSTAPGIHRFYFERLGISASARREFVFPACARQSRDASSVGSEPNPYRALFIGSG